jgi:hypothetical protein
MNPFEKNEPKVKVKTRAASANVELVLIVGLIVLLIGVANGL